MSQRKNAHISSGGSNRATRGLPFLTKSATRAPEVGPVPGRPDSTGPLPGFSASSALSALPRLDGRSLRELLAHAQTLGGTIPFFEAGSAPFGNWGEALLRDPLTALAVLLESEPQEDDRPARLGHLLGLAQSLPAVRELLDETCAPSADWSCTGMGQSDAGGGLGARPAQGAQAARSAEAGQAASTGQNSHADQSGEFGQFIQSGRFGALAAILSDERRERVFARIDRAVRDELAWQNLWAARLEEAGLPCAHPLYGQREERAESGFSNSLPGFLERDFPGYARLLRKKPTTGGRNPAGERDFGGNAEDTGNGRKDAAQSGCRSGVGGASAAVGSGIFRAWGQSGSQGGGGFLDEFIEDGHALSGFQWLLEDAEPESALAAEDQPMLAASLRDALASLHELVLLLGLRRAALLEHAESAWRELAAKPRGLLAPHTGMLLAFLRLYAGLQADQNALPAAHADYFYRRLLGFAPQPPRPDKALVTFASEDGAPFFSLPAGTRLVADNPSSAAPEDAELEFRTLEVAPVNPARLSEVLCIAPAICGGKAHAGSAQAQAAGQTGPAWSSGKIRPDEQAGPGATTGQIEPTEQAGKTGQTGGAAQPVQAGQLGRAAQSGQPDQSDQSNLACLANLESQANPAEQAGPPERPAPTAGEPDGKTLPGPWCRVLNVGSQLAAASSEANDAAGADGGQGGPAGGAVLDLWPQTMHEGELRVCPTLLALPDFELGGGERWLELRFELTPGCINSAPPSKGSAAAPQAPCAALRVAWRRLAALGAGRAVAAPGWLSAAFSVADGWAEPEFFRLELRFPQIRPAAGNKPQRGGDVPEKTPEAERGPEPHETPAVMGGNVSGTAAAAGFGEAASAFTDFQNFATVSDSSHSTNSAASPDCAAAPSSAAIQGSAAQVNPQGFHSPARGSILPENALPLREPGFAPAQGPELVLHLRLGADQPPLAAPSAAEHGFAAAWPVLRLAPLPGDLANPERGGVLSAFWSALASFRVRGLKSAVSVRGLCDFLVGSGGSLVPNPQDTGFEPFGGAPGPAASFIFEVPELSGKWADRLRIRWNWDAPESFARHFKPYPFRPIRLSPAWRRAGGQWQEFSGNAQAPETELTGSAVTHLDCLPVCAEIGAWNAASNAAATGFSGGSGKPGSNAFSGVSQGMPATLGERPEPAQYPDTDSPAESCATAGRADGLTGVRWRLSSEGSLFGHAAYPALQAKAALNESSLTRRAFAFITRGLNLRSLNQPYTPLWRDLAVDYDSRSAYGPQECALALRRVHPFTLNACPDAELAGGESAAQPWNAAESGFESFASCAPCAPAAPHGPADPGSAGLPAPGHAAGPHAFWERSGCWPGRAGAGQGAEPWLPRLFAHYDNYSLALGFTVPELSLAAESGRDSRFDGGRGNRQKASRSPLALYFRLQGKNGGSHVFSTAHVPYVPDVLAASDGPEAFRPSYPAGAELRPAEAGPLLAGGRLLDDETNAFARSGILRVLPGLPPVSSGLNAGPEAYEASDLSAQAGQSTQVAQVAQCVQYTQTAQTEQTAQFDQAAQTAQSGQIGQAGRAALSGMPAPASGSASLTGPEAVSRLDASFKENGGGLLRDGLFLWPLPEPQAGAAPHFRLRLDWSGPQAPPFALQKIHDNAAWAEYVTQAGIGQQSGTFAVRPFPLPPGRISRLKPQGEDGAGAAGVYPAGGLATSLARYLDTLQIEQPYPSTGGAAAVPAMSAGNGTAVFAGDGAAAWQGGHDAVSGQTDSGQSNLAQDASGYAGSGVADGSGGGLEEAGSRACPAGISPALAAFWQNSAESLSHREQAILPRDYERIALRGYPEIMSALCLPHCAGDALRPVPGAVGLAVFAPQEGAKIWPCAGAGGFILNPALPAYADSALLETLRDDLRSRSSPFAQLHVLQPHYQPLRLRLRAVCDPWMNLGQAGHEAQSAIERAIASWAFAPAAASFGQPLRPDTLFELLLDFPWLTRLLACELLAPASGANGARALNLLDAAQRALPLPPPTPYSFFYPQHLEIRLTAGGSA